MQNTCPKKKVRVRKNYLESGGSLAKQLQEPHDLAASGINGAAVLLSKLLSISASGLARLPSGLELHAHRLGQLIGETAVVFPAR